MQNFAEVPRRVTKILELLASLEDSAKISWMDVSFLKKCLNSMGKEDLVVILIEFEMSHIKIKLSKILAPIRALLHKKLKPRLTFNPKLTLTPSRKIRPWALRTMTHALEAD